MLKWTDKTGTTSGLAVRHAIGEFRGLRATDATADDIVACLRANPSAAAEVLSSVSVDAEARAEVERRKEELRGELAVWRDGVGRRCCDHTRSVNEDADTIADLRARVRVLEEALEWYADEANYDSDHAPGTPEPNVPREYAGWDADCGDRARAALAKGGE